MPRAMPLVALFVASTAAAAGPQDLLESYRFDRIERASGDGAYAYAHYYRDADRQCWGRVLRVELATGATSQVVATCYATDFVVVDGVAYVAAQGDPFDGQGGGLIRDDFVSDAERIASTPATAIAADATYLYYADGAAIHRIRPDGSGDTVLGAAAAGRLFVDDAAVYGLDGRTLWRMPRSGGSATTLATLGSSTDSILLDDDQFLWVDGGQRIRRVATAGGSVTTFYATSTSQVRGLAVTGGQVYWSSGLDLKRRPRGGGDVERVVTAETNSAVAGADASGIYYTRWSTPAPPLLSLRRVAVADLVAPQCSDTPVELAPAAAPLGVSATGSWVYYTEGDSVGRVWRNGGTRDVMAADQPGARALFADEEGLSWATDAGANSTPFEWPPAGALYPADAADVIGAPEGGLYFIDGVRLVGPGNVTLATGLAPYRLALGVTYLYWTDRGDDSIRRVPRAGGAVQVLARVSGTVGDLTTDSEIFVGVDDGATGRILRLPFTGGTPALVAEGSFSPYDLKIAGTHLYFTSQGPGTETVYRVARAGGTPTVRARGGEAWELDTLGSCVYYLTATGVSVVSKN